MTQIAAPQGIDLSTNDAGLSNATVTMTTDKGVMKFKFYPKDAPNTVNRIATLVQNGYFNGLKFHRVVPGFVIQGGDPTGTGAGGSGVKLKAEFNSRKHTPGVLSMARTADPDSADSQFFVMLGTHLHLDGQYTVFGTLIEGANIPGQIEAGDKMTTVTIE